MKYLKLIVASIVIAILVITIFMVSYQAKDVIQTIHQEGVDAHKNYVPATANPYIQSPALAKIWLNGWMEDAKKDHFQLGR